jgi:iron complex transport system substrate-binding protein
MIQFRCALALVLLSFSLSAQASPQRIVSLAPSLTEIILELIEPQSHRVVGITEYTAEHPQLREAKSVGPFHRFNLEAVVGLKPDWVFATRDGNSKDQVERLAELGLRVLTVSTESLEEVGRSVQLIGEALGRKDLAKLKADAFHRELQELEKTSRPVPLPRVMLQLGAEPLVVVGGKGFLSSALQLAGAQNVYSDWSKPYPRPSVEDVVRRKPDWILILGMGKNPSEFDRIVADWKRFANLPAVQKKQVVVLFEDTLARPGLKTPSGIRALRKLIQGNVL